jgi:hypothetical protein
MQSPDTLLRSHPMETLDPTQGGIAKNIRSVRTGIMMDDSLTVFENPNVQKVERLNVLDCF